MRVLVRSVDLTGLRAGDGAPLLMLHGAGGPRSIAAACERLAKSFSVFAPTHPGFADCPEVDRFDTIDDLAYLYPDLLDELDLRDVDRKSVVSGKSVSVRLDLGGRRH